MVDLGKARTWLMFFPVAICWYAADYVLRADGAGATPMYLVFLSFVFMVPAFFVGNVERNSVLLWHTISDLRRLVAFLPIVILQGIFLMCNLLAFEFLTPSLVLMFNIVGHLFFVYFRYLRDVSSGRIKSDGVFGTLEMAGVLISFIAFVFLCLAEVLELSSVTVASSSSSGAVVASSSSADLHYGPNLLEAAAQAAGQQRLSPVIMLLVTLAALIIGPLASQYSREAEEAGIDALQELRVDGIPSDNDLAFGGDVGPLRTTLIGMHGIFGSILMLAIVWPLSLALGSPNLSPVMPLLTLVSLPVLSSVFIATILFGSLGLYVQRLRRAQAVRSLSPYEHDMRQHLTVLLLWLFGTTGNYLAKRLDWPVHLDIDGWSYGSLWQLCGYLLLLGGNVMFRVGEEHFQHEHHDGHKNEDEDDETMPLSAQADASPASDRRGNIFRSPSRTPVDDLSYEQRREKIVKDHWKSICLRACDTRFLSLNPKRLNEIDTEKWIDARQSQWTAACKAHDTKRDAIGPARRERALKYWELLRSAPFPIDLERCKANAEFYLPHDKSEPPRLLPWFSVSLDELAASMGNLSVALYMRFLKNMIFVFLAMGVLALPAIISNLQGKNTVPLLVMGSLAQTTDPPALLTAITDAVGIVFFCVLVVYLIVDFREKARSWKQDVRRISDFTIQVQNIPRVQGIHYDDIRAFFGQYGKVVNVVLCTKNAKQLKVHESLGEVSTQVELQSREVRRTMRRCDSDPTQRGLLEKETKTLEELQQSLDQLYDEAARLDKRVFECSGIAFVTFERQSVAKKLLKQGITRRISFSKLLEEDPTLAEKHPELENGVCFKIVKAPEPSDIIWENLQYTDDQRQTAQAMIYFVSMVAITLSVSAIVVFLYWQTHVMASQKTGLKILATALGPIALGVSNVCIFATQPILAIKYERNPSWTSFERNVTIRLFLFQILNAALTVLIFVYMDLDFHVRCWPKVDIPIDPHEIAARLSSAAAKLSGDNSMETAPEGACAFDSYWFSTGGVTVINSMIGDIAFINVVLEWIRPDKMIQRHWLAKRARSQHEANMMYEGPDFMIAFRYQLILKFIFMGLMFSTAIPVSSFVVALFLAESYFIDKYNLCRQYKKPKDLDPGLLELLLLKIVPVAVVLHFTIGSIFLWEYANASPAYRIVAYTAAVVVPLLLFKYGWDWWDQRQRAHKQQMVCDKVAAEGDELYWANDSTASLDAGNDDDPVLALTTARAALRPVPAGTDVFVQRVGGDTFFNGRRARVKSFQNGLYTVELKEGQKELLLEPEFVGDDTNLSDLVLPVSDPCNLRYMPPLTAIKCKSKLKG